MKHHSLTVPRSPHVPSWFCSARLNHPKPASRSCPGITFKKHLQYIYIYIIWIYPKTQWFRSLECLKGLSPLKSLAKSTSIAGPPLVAFRGRCKASCWTITVIEWFSSLLACWHRQGGRPKHQKMHFLLRKQQEPLVENYHVFCMERMGKVIVSWSVHGCISGNSKSKLVCKLIEHDRTWRCWGRIYAITYIYIQYIYIYIYIWLVVWNIYIYTFKIDAVSQSV